jgi:hypothetical protein
MIDVILSRLDKVKQTSPDSWLACCPAHEDRQPSLTLRDNGGMILLHCFAGCETNAILAALDVAFTDLFPEQLEHRLPPAGARRRFNPHDVMEAVASEAAVIFIVGTDMTLGRSIAQADMDRLGLAVRRVHEAVEVMRGD